MKKAKEFNLRNSFFIDNTAGNEVSKMYRQCLTNNIAVATCNKIFCASELENYKRNTQIRNYASTLFKKYPHWQYDFIIDKTANKYFLSFRTVQAIIKGEGIYAY